MSQLEVDKIIPQSGTTLTIGDSGDTVNFADGTALSIDTNTLYIDSTNNRVGIGTTSPQRILHIHDSQPYLQLTSSSTGTTSTDGFQLIVSGSEAVLMQRENSAMSFHTNGSEAMRITSDGKVGIGTTSVDTNLHIESSSGSATVRVEASSSEKGDLQANSGNITLRTIGSYPLVFNTNQTERSRIDINGNLMVGKTSVDTSTSGVEFRSDGLVGATRASNPPLLLNRRTDDGNVVLIRKDNSNVGFIGVKSSNVFMASNTSNNTGFKINPDAITPSTYTGTDRDNAIDLGASSSRYKDLYLGNSIDLSKSTNQAQVNIRSTVTPNGSKLGGEINLSLGSGSNSGSGNTSTQVGDILGNINFNGQGTDYSFQGGAIEVQQTTPIGQTNRTDAGCDMIFKVISAGGTGYTEKLRIKSSGGITFNGDTSVNNALDDYEKGTWTPVASNTSDWSGFVETNMNVYMAQYTKVGRKVTVMAGITFPDSGSSALSTGDAIQLSGLPFSIGGSGTDDVYGAIPAQVFLRDSTNGGIAHANISYQDRIALRVVATHGSGARYQSGLRLSATYFTD
jgi:hypothetical protein